MHFFTHCIRIYLTAASLFLLGGVAQAQNVERAFSGSASVAGLIDFLNSSVEDVRVAKRNVNVLLRSGLKSKKREKAENLVSDAELVILDNKQSIRKLRRLLQRVFEDELDGIISQRNKNKYSRLADRVNRQSGKNHTMINRMNSFHEKNKPKPAANFGGRWNTNFGPIVFAQTKSNNVTATYFWSGGGTVSGKVNGQVLSGTYRDGNGYGTFRVIMFDSGDRWSGRYNASKGVGSGVWSANR